MQTCVLLFVYLWRQKGVIYRTHNSKTFAEKNIADALHLITNRLALTIKIAAHHKCHKEFNVGDILLILPVSFYVGYNLKKIAE